MVTNTFTQMSGYTMPGSGPGYFNVVFIFSQIINPHFKGTFRGLIFDSTEIVKLQKSLER